MPGYHLPCFAGEAEETYRRHGLDVELVDPEPGADNVRAVASGRYDVCLTSVAYYLRARQDDPDLGAKFVFMVARRTHMAAFCLARSSIERLEDLDGASVLGAADSPFVQEYRALLERLGLQAGPLLELPYDEVMDALAARAGDVAADYLDLLPAFEAAAHPAGEEIRVLPFGPAVDVYGSGLVAGTRLIDERPSAVRGAVASLREALLVARRDPGVGLDALLARFPDTDPERALAGWSAGQQLIFDDDVALGTMDEATWRRTIDFHADTHGTPRVAAASVFDPSFL